MYEIILVEKDGSQRSIKTDNRAIEEYGILNLCGSFYYYTQTMFTKDCIQHWFKRAETADVFYFSRDQKDAEQ